MQGKWKEILLREVQDKNILPLTSRCNLACIFCSHRQNPPPVEVIRLPDLSMELLWEIQPFINPEKKITIGESVTRIIEGEPFLHPDICGILGFLREKFPKTTIQITTNGTKLTPAMVNFLASLSKVELYFSLNSINIETRRKFLGDQDPGIPVEAVKLLGEAGIPFHGSLVAMPHLTGWKEIEDTVLYLEAHGAQTARIFRPGYTKEAPPQLQFALSLWDELDMFVQSLKTRLRMPLLLEPPKITDLRAEVEGVLPDSPADLDGIEKGDKILRIGGMSMRSRVEAFYAAQAALNPRIEVERGEMSFAFLVFKKENTPSGLVMNYDLDPARFDAAIAKVRQKKARQVKVLTSVLAEAMVREYLTSWPVNNVNFNIIAVKNNFFGGTIFAGGLLTVEDFLQAAQEGGEKPDLLLVPGEPFDYQGKDLTGRSYLEIEQTTGIETVIV